MKKTILLVSAIALIFASCSNSSDSAIGYAALLQPTVQETAPKESVTQETTPQQPTVQEEPINQTEVVDFGEDLSDYEEAVASEDSEHKWNWVYIPVDWWNGEWELENKRPIYTKPVLKIKSDDRGVVFNRWQSGNVYKRVDWVYKCVVYVNKRNTTNNHAQTTASFYYKDPQNQRLGGYDLYITPSGTKFEATYKKGSELDKYLIW